MYWLITFLSCLIDWPMMGRWIKLICIKGTFYWLAASMELVEKHQTGKCVWANGVQRDEATSVQIFYRLHAAMLER